MREEIRNFVRQVLLCCQVRCNGGPRDPSALCALIRVAGRHDDLSQIEVWWKQLYLAPLEKILDKSVFNAAIETCLTTGNLVMAADHLKRSQGLRPLFRERTVPAVQARRPSDEGRVIRDTH